MHRTRRAFLSATGAVGAAALAGCSSSGGSGGDGEQAPLIVTHDTVVAAETVAQGQAPCSLTNQFLHRQKVIFRVKVVDPDTGEELSGDAVSNVAIDIKTGGGSTVKANYGPHPPQNATDEYWVAPWTVPDDFPAGPVDYEITVEDGRDAQTYGFDVPPSNLTVLEGTYSGGSGGN